MLIDFAFNDLRKGFQLFRYWLYAASIKIQLEHNKTFFSILWGPVTVFIVATVLSLVWAQILNEDSPLDFFFYILIGFALWSLLISSIVNRAVPSLSKRSAELSQAVRPVSLLPLEDIAYSFLNFLITLPFVVLACVFYYGFSLQLFLMFTLGLLLVWVTALGLCLTLGILGFFFRDVLQLLKAVMRLGFLVTPIIWKPDRLGEYEYLVWLNPFHSYIDFCRAPLMGQMPHANSITVVLALTTVLTICAFLTMAIYGNKVRARAFI